MRSATEVRRELELSLRSRTPALGLDTWEESRALRLVRDVARVLSPGRDLFTWTAGQGLRLEGQAVLGLPIPCTMTEALATVGEHKGPAIFLFFDPDLTDPGVARRIRDLALITGGQPRSLIFVGPALALHPSLHRVVSLLRMPTPDKTELKNILSAVASRCSSLVGVEIQIAGEASDRLADAARGMTAEEAERSFIRALLQVQRLSAREVPLILHEKRRLLDRHPLLTYLSPEETLDDLGGLEVVKAWIRRRGKAFSESAVTAGLTSPRGVLLVGMTGCGRGHLIRASAASWELPLFRLEISLLIGSGSQSGTLLRRSLLEVEDLSPAVLWIPGLDQLFQRGSETDGGRAEHEVASVLQTWLLEKNAPVFVAATADDHERLPLELLWKRAFDEVFFIDFPTSEERRQILQSLLRRRGLEPQDLNLEMLVAASDGFSGAQIEAAIERGLGESFDGGRSLKMVDIVQSLRQMTPMSGFMGEPRRKLRAWAHRRAVSASPVKEP